MPPNFKIKPALQSDELALRIAELHKNGMRNKIISDKLRVSMSYVGQVVGGRIRSEVTGIQRAATYPRRSYGCASYQIGIPYRVDGKFMLCVADQTLIWPEDGEIKFRKVSGIASDNGHKKGNYSCRRLRDAWGEKGFALLQACMDKLNYAPERERMLNRIMKDADSGYDEEDVCP